jgi:hypothetical protein
MPRIKKNSLIKGASGKFRDDMVYIQKGGNTYFGDVPTIDPNRVPTDKQEEVMDRFTSASAYASEALLDQELKKFYQSKVEGPNSAFNVAFSDFQRKPRINEIFVGLYTGAVGSEIAVSAKKRRSKVSDVKVRIFSPAGVLIEEGKAVLNRTRLDRWYYVATQNNPVLPGTKITVIATDLPGNEVSLDKIL